MGAYDIDTSDTDGLVNGDLRIEEGKEKTIKVIVKPFNTLDKVIFSSDNEKVAKVDVNGKVTAVSPGTARIDIVAGDMSTYINISVYKVESKELPTVDTTKPVEEVKAGVSDESVNNTLKETTNDIIFAVNDPKNASTNAIDEETKVKVNEALKLGKTISTEVKVQTKEDKEISKEKVEKEIEKISAENKTEAIVCQYLDLSVALLADGTQLGNINELNKEVEFKVVLPKDLVKDGRKFYVVRVHDGIAKILATTLNDDGTLSFKTNKFSAYAVVYEDAKEPAKDPSKEPAPKADPKEESKTPTSSLTPGTTPSAKAHEVKAEAKKEETKKVETGDESRTMLYVELGLMAVVGCAILFLQNKKSRLLKK